VICFWCHKPEDVTEDHIVPQSIGGTLDFKVDSCSQCQTKLSRAEYELARRSTLAVHALASPVRPRHPERPTSGRLRPKYLLVKHPLGGYGETLFSAGERISALAHFEIRVVLGEPVEGRVRGPSATEAQLLLDLYREQFRKKVAAGAQPVCELKTELVVDPEIAADPDFWPRIVLLPGKTLLIRARDVEEALRFIKVFNERVALTDYRVNPEAWSSGAEIAGGSIHWLALHFDPRCLRRVAAKIAYGLFSGITNRPLEVSADRLMRGYIVGDETTEEPVCMAPQSATFTTANKPHSIVISPPCDSSGAFVSFYGTAHFRVELGKAAILPRPIVVICESDGSGMRVGTEQDAVHAVEQLRTLTFSKP
jgi:hypothetical protein